MPPRGEDALGDDEGHDPRRIHRVAHLGRRGRCRPCLHTLRPDREPELVRVAGLSRDHGLQVEDHGAGAQSELQIGSASADGSGNHEMLRGAVERLPCPRRRSLRHQLNRQRHSEHEPRGGGEPGAHSAAQPRPGNDRIARGASGLHGAHRRPGRVLEIAGGTDLQMLPDAFGILGRFTHRVQAQIGDVGMRLEERLARVVDGLAELLHEGGRAAAVVAVTQMPLDIGGAGGIQTGCGIVREVLAILIVIGHRSSLIVHEPVSGAGSAWPLRPSSSCAMRRHRKSRDFTVPTGTFKLLAISP